MHLTVIAPVFNERLGIIDFIREVSLELIELKSFGVTVELLLVDDGSTDKTAEEIRKIKSRIPVKVIRLSRNFGHQTAVWAGIEKSNPKSHVIVMDSDLQDPPKYIGDIFSALKDNTDVIFMKRISRDDGFWKKIFARFYYKLNSWLIGNREFENIGDFFGLSPRAKLALLNHPEKSKYIRGLLVQLGFTRKVLYFDREKRRVGTTKYTLTKMFGLAISGVTGFSIKPLILVVHTALIGMALSGFGVVYILYLNVFSQIELQPGWSFLAVCILLLSTFQLMGSAMISLYLARVVQEVKNRPLYFIDDESQG